MEDLTDVVEGDSLCVLGYGTAAVVHQHHTVVSVTKLYINSENKNPDRQGRRRHRREDGASTPYSGYGGTTASRKCQKKPKK